MHIACLDHKRWAQKSSLLNTLDLFATLLSQNLISSRNLKLDHHRGESMVEVNMLPKEYRSTSGNRREQRDGK
jgi:hypothetical protein